MSSAENFAQYMYGLHENMKYASLVIYKQTNIHILYIGDKKWTIALYMSVFQNLLKD